MKGIRPICSTLHPGKNLTASLIKSLELNVILQSYRSARSLFSDDHRTAFHWPGDGSADGVYNTSAYDDAKCSQSLRPSGTTNFHGSTTIYDISDGSRSAEFFTASSNWNQPVPSEHAHSPNHRYGPFWSGKRPRHGYEWPRHFSTTQFQLHSYRKSVHGYRIRSVTLQHYTLPFSTAAAANANAAAPAIAYIYFCSAF